VMQTNPRLGSANCEFVQFISNHRQERLSDLYLVESGLKN
jgi:hypothetical protein